MEELDKGGIPAVEDNKKGQSPSQRKKSVMHRDLVSDATRRFSGIGLELNEAAGTTLKENLLKLAVSMKEEDPWLAGLSPLYKVPKFPLFLCFCLFHPLSSFTAMFYLCKRITILHIGGLR